VEPPQLPEFALRKDEVALHKLWRSYWSLGFVQVALALSWLVFGSSGGETAIAFKRALLALTVVLALVFAVLGLEAWLRWSRTINRMRRLTAWISRPRTYFTLFTLSALLFLGGLYLITLTPELIEPFARSLFPKLQVFFLLGAGLGLQTLVALWLLRFGRIKLDGLKTRPVFLFVLIGFGLVFGVWALLRGTIVQQARQLVGWNDPGPPVMELQTALAFAVGIAVLFWLDRSKKFKEIDGSNNRRTSRVDLWICLLIWLAAALLWGLTPIQPNWFRTEAVFPSKVSFPSSDARVYDAVAQNALTGSGYRFENTIFIRRPLHALYLTVLHLLGGQNYDRITWLQVLALAWLPVMIYLLVKKLSNRPAGVVAALMALFRETNSIRIAGNITTSNVKELMVDVPMALLMVVFLLLTTKWIDERPGVRLWAALSGMALGMAMLVRIESAVVFIALLFVLIVQPAWQKKADPGKPRWLLQNQLLFFTIGLGLVLLPWMARNTIKTGLVFLTEPDPRLELILQRFNPLPEVQPTTEVAPQAEIPGAPVNPPSALQPAVTGETASETPSDKKNKPVSTLVPTKTPLPPNLEQAARATLLQSLRSKRQLALVGLAHLFNSTIQSLLVLPTTFRGFDALTSFIGHRSLEGLAAGCCSVTDYTRRLPYWPKWNGTIALQSTLPLMFNIVILAAGIQHLWRRLRWLGLLPLVSALVYLSLNALFRNSGGRYILPVDWVVIVYFSLGLIQVFCWLWRLFFQRTFDTQSVAAIENSPTHARRNNDRAPWVLAVVLILIALAIPLMEAVFPLRFTDQHRAQMLEQLLSSKTISSAERGMLASFIDSGAYMLSGRVLYPQYFTPNSGSLGIKSAPIPPRPYPRLIFNLAGPQSIMFELARQERPERIRHASDGLLIACPNSYTVALATFGAGEKLETVTLAAFLPETNRCPGGE